MQILPRFLKNSRPFVLLLLGASLLLAGCGGGGGDSTPATPTAILAPKSLVGAVLLVNYGDGRSFTLNFNSGSPNGITRSDAKTSTNWIASGYGEQAMAIDIAYGAFANTAPENLSNVFDKYVLTFLTKTTGQCVLRENITSSSFSTSVPIACTFTFTTYPPGG